MGVKSGISGTQSEIEGYGGINDGGSDWIGRPIACGIAPFSDGGTGAVIGRPIGYTGGSSPITYIPTFVDDQDFGV